jgi:hypothetical protein
MWSHLGRVLLRMCVCLSSKLRAVGTALISLVKVGMNLSGIVMAAVSSSDISESGVARVCHVCVREREKERKRERQRGKVCIYMGIYVCHIYPYIYTHTHTHTHTHICIYIYHIYIYIHAYTWLHIYTHTLAPLRRRHTIIGKET